MEVALHPYCTPRIQEEMTHCQDEVRTQLSWAPFRRCNVGPIQIIRFFSELDTSLIPPHTVGHRLPVAAVTTVVLSARRLRGSKNPKHWILQDANKKCGCTSPRNDRTP